MKFNMDPNWEEVVNEAANEAITERFQPILDSVFNECAGDPIHTVKAVLVERWASGNNGASITEPELTTVAQAISEGKRAFIKDGHLFIDEDD